MINLNIFRFEVKTENAWNESDPAQYNITELCQRKIIVTIKKNQQGKIVKNSVQTI